MKRILFTLLLITALLTGLSCERRGGGTSGSDTGPIKVGVYADLSGQTSSFGQSTVNGIKMAADEINKAGGVGGRQIELIIEDDQGRPEQAATVVTKLISQNQVNAVLGEVASSNSLAAAPKAQAAKVPMITPSSTNPKVTQVGDYIFRVCFIDP
ncbi:MAG TPA: ABC transporter substrate-binding protein, partial [Pyrinomonadaceae bacterium]